MKYLTYITYAEPAATGQVHHPHHRHPPPYTPIPGWATKAVTTAVGTNGDVNRYPAHNTRGP